MYCLEKSMSKKNPSFSSTLLDKIYHSIEGGHPQHQDKMICSRGFGTKKKMKCDQNVMCSRAPGEERISSIQRNGYTEKVQDNHAAKKFEGRRDKSRHEFDRRSKYENDHLFFSSISGGLSLSESESFCKGASAMSSCFLPRRPKPIRTKVTSPLQNKAGDVLFLKLGNLHSLYDDGDGDDDNENKEFNFNSKSRDLKIYASFKKVKQPISPGVRLTKFINALFSNGPAKKSKSSSSTGGLGNNYVGARSMPPSQPASSCSFSRSCLSKNSPSTRERLRNGVKRSVKFYPVSEIVGEHPRPCAQQSVYSEDPSRGNFMNLGSRTKFEELQRKKLSDHCNLVKEDDEDDEDAMSDSSSDLFDTTRKKTFSGGYNRRKMA